MGIELRTSYDKLFFEDMLPALEEVAYAEWEQSPDILPKIFNFDSMNKEIIQQLNMGDVPPAQQVAEGADTPYVELSQGYSKTYTALTYKLGIQCSEELLEDDRHDLINKYHKGLATGHFKARQIVAHTIYWNGTADTGYDGKTLFATDHPLVNGGTGSNRVAGNTVLSVAGLEQMDKLFMEMPDEDGAPVVAMAKTLLIPPALKHTARRLLKSTGSAESANLITNPFLVDNYEILVDPWLAAAFGGSDTAYYMLTEPSKMSVMFYERVPFTSKSGEDFDSGGVKTKTRQRFAVGWHGWRGVACSTGA